MHFYRFDVFHDLPYVKIPSYSLDTRLSLSYVHERTLNYITLANILLDEYNWNKFGEEKNHNYIFLDLFIFFLCFYCLGALFRLGNF